MPVYLCRWNPWLGYRIPNSQTLSPASRYSLPHPQGNTCTEGQSKQRKPFIISGLWPKPQWRPRTWMPMWVTEIKSRNTGPGCRRTRRLGLVTERTTSTVEVSEIYVLVPLKMLVWWAFGLVISAYWTEFLICEQVWGMRRLRGPQRLL